MSRDVNDERGGAATVGSFKPRALDRPFTLLTEARQPEGGTGLPEEFRRVYGGDWRIPPPQADPYVYANFVVSHDGRISFGEQGNAGGEAVSGSNPHDLWLMGLLRARADAVLIGDGIVRNETDYDCRAGWVCPADVTAFDALRVRERRRARYLNVVVTFNGDIPPEAAVLRDPAIDTILATTEAGRENCLRLCEEANAQAVEVRTFGTDRVDLTELMRTLQTEYGVSTVLCEGGALLYGGMLSEGLVTDEFLTLAPLIIGPGRENERRPSLVDGTSFSSADHPESRLRSVRIVGDHLFLHSRYRPEDA